MEEGISIIMPCLNEEKTIGICIKKALDSIQKLGLNGEVLIADNGSTDNSVTIANQLGARVVHIKDKGYGNALRGGIKEALYPDILMGDADDSYDFSEISLFLEKLNEGYDLVMGNRFRGGIEKGAMPFSHRYIGNPFLSGIGRLFFNTKEIGDFHCGMRAFKKKSIEKLDLCTTGMEFASEMVVKAVLFDLKITEVPCKLYPDGRDRPPHLKSIPDGLRHLEFLLLYSPKWLFAYPGFVLFVLGMIFVIYIFFQPLQIGKIQFEVTTMLYCALAMLLGMHFLQFSVFSVVFAERIGQIPRVSKITKMLIFINNKVGYYLAFIIILVGFCGIVFSLFLWGEEGFGQLNTTMVCRTAILFGSLFASGIELLLYTLFMRVLQIGKVNNE